MSLLSCKARSFNSFLVVQKILAFLHLFLISAHIQQSLQFTSRHGEIGELSGHDKAPLALVFAAVDVFLLIATVVLLVLKTKLTGNLYLTDSENRLYGTTIIFSVVCSCVLAYLAHDASLPDQTTPEVFEKAMLLAMASYPKGPKKRLVDLIQIKYSCCGAIDPTEWFSIDWYDRKSNWTQDDVPFSCCSSSLQIPCVHINMKRHTYYIKYNSSNPTIWTDGCAAKFKDVYFLEFDWLVYLGAVVSVASFSFALLDKMSQTADNTFALNGRFQLGFWSSEPQWDCLIDYHNRLAQERKPSCSNIRSSKPKSVWRNVSEVILNVEGRTRNRKHKSLRTAASQISPCDCARSQRRTGSPSNSLQSTICEDASVSSGSSARKRKSECFLPSSCLKRTKKEN